MSSLSSSICFSMVSAMVASLVSSRNGAPWLRVNPSRLRVAALGGSRRQPRLHLQARRAQQRRAVGEDLLVLLKKIDRRLAAEQRGERAHREVAHDRIG